VVHKLEELAKNLQWLVTFLSKKSEQLTKYGAGDRD
jgi:hypothetical protein